jgi:hypothetical protein
MRVRPYKDPKLGDDVYQAPRGILGKFFMGLFGSTMTARPGWRPRKPDYWPSDEEKKP